MSVGCTKSDNTNQKSDTNTSAPTETPIEIPPVNKTGLPIVNEPVTFTIMVKKHVSDKTTWADKECVKKAESETGIKFNWIEVQTQGWEEKFAMTLSSGDLPDVIIGTVNNFTPYLDSFIPLNDYIEDYAPTLLEIFERYPQVKAGITQEDGKIYSLPLGQFTDNYANLALSINKTWLDNLGLKEPETLDELHMVLKAFKEKDPNKNGKPDEIPLSFYQDPNHCYDLTPMMWNFGLIMDGQGSQQHYVMVENGKINFIGSDPRFYDFLVFMNKLNKDGLLDPDGFIQKHQDFITKGQNGLIGLFGHHSYDDIVVGAENTDDYVAMLPVKDEDGNRTVKPNKMPGDFQPDKFKITTACKYPEAMVRFWDYVNSSLENKLLWSFGPENVVYSKDESGKYVKATEFPEGIQNFAELRQTMSTGMAGFWFTTPDDNIFELAPRDKKVIVDRYNKYSPYFVNELIPYGADSMEVTQNRAIMFTEIDTYMQNFMAESILKGIDEAKWSTHLENLKKLNIDQFVSDYQNFYDRTITLMNK